MVMYAGIVQFIYKNATMSLLSAAAVEKLLVAERSVIWTRIRFFFFLFFFYIASNFLFLILFLVVMIRKINTVEGQYRQ